MHYQPVEPTDSDMYISQAATDSYVQPPNDPLDDVFGDNEDEHIAAQSSHPSDMRRLQTDHSTAGYREGVNVGKQDSLQKGFDEGYTIGAAIGLQAGQILGILEGIAEALNDDKEMGELLQQAKDDLSVEKLFSSEFWTADGLPSYDIEESSLQRKDGALSHPSVRKWTDIMEEQIRRWGIKESVLDVAQPEASGKMTDEQTDLSSQAAVENPLDW